MNSVAFSLASQIGFSRRHFLVVNGLAFPLSNLERRKVILKLRTWPGAVLFGDFGRDFRSLLEHRRSGNTGEPVSLEQTSGSSVEQLCKKEQTGFVRIGTDRRAPAS